MTRCARGSLRCKQENKNVVVLRTTASEGWQKKGNGEAVVRWIKQSGDWKGATACVAHGQKDALLNTKRLLFVPVFLLHSLLRRDCLALTFLFIWWGPEKTKSLGA